MVVGDIVNDVSTTPLTFQPAASVSIMISQAAPNVDDYINLTDGVTSRRCFYYGAAGYGSVANVKVMINNSIYLTIPNVSGGCYSGIQIQ
jgi:hypothetical protein